MLFGWFVILLPQPKERKAMKMPKMTSMQRVLTALSFNEPDRVPLFILLTVHGAREMGLSIHDYFKRPDLMAEAQIRMRNRYGSDCLYGFTYASAEFEAFGGESIFFNDGPPNAGAPIIQHASDILKLAQPRIEDSPGLMRALDFQSRMKQAVGDEVPIIGVVMSPASLPIMQLGFEAYLKLITDSPELFWQLMTINEAFCIEWANAQLNAGATAICYFDPASSSTIMTPEQYRNIGQTIAKRVLPRINGPVATHFASGRSLPIIDDVAETGTAIVCVSVLEDLAEVKAAAGGRMNVLGNLDGIAMRNWTPEQAESAVREAISKAGQGGGFILSDNHGEIPWQVSESVLDAISLAAHHWGQYPLKGAKV